MMKRGSAELILIGVLATLTQSHAADRKILVYTRNYTPDGKGYVHDNIAASVAAIKKMGAEKGFAVDTPEGPGVFTAENLKQYSALVFSNSNNEAFANDTQREAFKDFIESGGGFVGIHSATGSERNWPHYWFMIGGKFLRHPPMQKLTIRVKDAGHPATAHMPANFEWEDECYLHNYLNPAMHVLLVTDPAQLKDPKRVNRPADLLGDSFPLAWTNHVERGRVFYTALGHKKEHYSDPLLYKHIQAGIIWAMGDQGK
jgi:type 1 glutamine amidotransferase